MSETEEPNIDEPGAPAPDQEAATAPPLVPAPAASAQGELGQPRGIVFVILLSIVTFGIYHLYWTYKSFAELQRHTGHGIGGWVGLAFAIFINPINWFVMPSEVGSMYRRDARASPMTGWTGLWMLLPLVGWFVWTIKIQGALNRYWESKTTAA